MPGIKIKQFHSKLGAAIGLVLMLLVAMFGYVASAHAAGVYSDVGQNIRASIAVGNHLKSIVEPSAGFPVKVIAAARKSNSPFQAVASETGNCILVINEKPESWAAWAAFVGQGDLNKTDSFYFAMLHELGHCINKLSSSKEFPSLPEGVDSELFADVFALVAGSQLLNQESYRQLARGVIKSRLAQDRWFSSGSHSTGSKLQKAYQLISGHDESALLNVGELAQLSREIFSDISGTRHPETALIVLPTATVN